MKMNEIQMKLYKKLLRSPLSKVFVGMAMISLSLSMINKTPVKLVAVEAFFYVSLAFTTNCLVYGECNLSALLVLIVPFTIILINIFEIFGFSDKIKSLKEIQEMKQLTEPTFLEKTEEEKKNLLMI
jgi:hypothetical protein